MKTEFITLGPVGLFCAIFMGALLADAWNSGLGSRDGLWALFFAGLLAWVLRSDARETFESGRYERGWLIWSRTGECE